MRAARTTARAPRTSLALGVLIALAIPGAARAQERTADGLPPLTLEEFRTAENESRAEVFPWFVLERGAFMWDQIAPERMGFRGPFDFIDLSRVPGPVLEEALADLARFHERNGLDMRDPVRVASGDSREMTRLRAFAEKAALAMRRALAARNRAAGRPFDTMAELRGVDGKLDIHRVVDSGLLFKPEALLLSKAELKEIQRLAIMSMGGASAVPFGELSKINERVASLEARPRDWTLDNLAGKTAEELRELAAERSFRVPANASRAELLRHLTGATSAEAFAAIGEVEPTAPGAERPRFTVEELAPMKIHEILIAARERGVEIPSGMRDRTEIIRHLGGLHDHTLFEVRELVMDLAEGRTARGSSVGIIDGIRSESNARRLREARARARGRGRARR